MFDEDPDDPTPEDARLRSQELDGTFSHSLPRLPGWDDDQGDGANVRTAPAELRVGLAGAAPPAVEVPADGVVVVLASDVRLDEPPTLAASGVVRLDPIDPDATFLDEPEGSFVERLSRHDSAGGKLARASGGACASRGTPST